MHAHVPLSVVNSPEDKHFATPSAHIIRVNPKLALKQNEVNIKLASSRNVTAIKEDDTASDAEAEKKAARIGGGYSMFAANNGVPTPSSVDGAQATPSSSTWVSASNVTLPSGLSKRDLVASQQKQQLKKRVVAHPGEPSATIKINVVGGEVLQNFTIIETGKSSPSATSTSIKAAQTAINVNIVHNGTGTSINEDEDEDATLLTFTFTLPISAISSRNETVTLVPAGNDAYIPYVNGKEVNSENENSTKATCTIPVDDDVLVAVARGQTFYSVCTTSDAVSKRVRVKVDVNAPTISSNTEEGEKTKRQMVAFFQAPAQLKNNQKNQNEKRQTVAFFQSPMDKTFSREEMMSDLWEDCIVGIDEGCLEVPEA